MPEHTTEYRLSMLEERVKENEEKNTKQHERFYTRFEALEQFQAVTGDRYSQLQKTVEAIALDVRLLREKPVKKWEHANSVIITVIVTAVVSFIIGGVFK